MRSVRGSGIRGALAGLVAALVLGAPAAHASVAGPVAAPDTMITKWRIDQAHSEITFRIRHMLGRIRGRFNTWQGTLLAAGTDWSTGTVSVTVEAKSIDTGNAARDADLRSDRFFAVEKYPEISFRSTRVELDGNDLTLVGKLKVRGQEHQVTFRGSYRGTVKDPNGNERVAFDAIASVDRNDFGIAWNQYVESGTRLGDTVDLELSVEAVRLK